jgi:hypothetical protein
MCVCEHVCTGCSKLAAGKLLNKDFHVPQFQYDILAETKNTEHYS